MGGHGSGRTPARTAAKKTTVEESLVLTASALVHQKVHRTQSRPPAIFAISRMIGG